MCKLLVYLLMFKPSRFELLFNFEGSTAGRRLLQHVTTFSEVVGSDTECARKDEFCNGELKANTQYT